MCGSVKARYPPLPVPITYSRPNHDNWFERCLGKKDESVLDNPISSLFQKRLYTKPVTVESTEAGKSTTILLWDDNKIFRALILSLRPRNAGAEGTFPRK